MTRKTPLSAEGLDMLFRKARTYNGWDGSPISDEVLHTLYDLMKMGPTSANCCPLRILFVKTPEAKAKLKPCLMEGNVAKTMSAPVTAILAYDPRFYDQLDVLSPAFDAKGMFLSSPDTLNSHAVRNATLQIGYFIMAARALGLDCGPMSGFNSDLLDKAFLEGTGFKSDILCNLGYGVEESLYPRAPRLSFEEAVQVV